MIHKSVYKHIEPKKFYVLYNILRIYYTDTYENYRKAIKSNNIESLYASDNMKTFYDNISLKISDESEALLLILSNFIVNENGYITTFDMSPSYFSELKRYTSNKFAILQDFSELCKVEDINNKIKTGILADDVLRLKHNFILFAFINKVIQSIDIAYSNSIEFEPIELTYGEFSCNANEDMSENIFHKISNQLELTTDEILFLRPRLIEILELNKYNVTEDNYEITNYIT